MENYTTSRGTGIITTNNITKFSSGVKTINITTAGTSLGDFVVPSDGFISATLSFFTAGQASTAYIECGITKNGGLFAWDQEAAPATGNYRMVSAAGMIDVVAGETIRAYIYSNVLGAYTYSYGYMFYPNS